MSQRPIPDIVQSMMLLIKNGRVKGQFARDLEALCIAATKAEPMHPKPLTPPAGGA